MPLSYVFQLGREKELSAAEIRAVFSRFHIPHSSFTVHGTCAFVETHEPLDVSLLMNTLGGTVSIGEEIPGDDPVSTIVSHIMTTQPTGKIHFSVSGSDAPAIAKEVKKELKNYERSVRYIEPKNSATILHNNLVERASNFVCLGKKVYVTRGIQPFESFGERDFGRPGRDSVRGMLPPKLARMMLNLAEQPTTATILDPFCGSGTILTEAILLGYTQLIGSDKASAAIHDTKENIAWLKAHANVTASPRLEIAAAENLGSVFPPRSVDAIVTEPYLGKPLRGNEQKSLLEKQVQELGGLYVQAFQVFSTLLKPGATVIFLVPSFRDKNSWIRIPCMEKVEKFGFKIQPFSPESPNLFYARPDQFVGREIWKLKKI
ncbi:MAG TPA: DNA methyltransferase [Candidatus Kapabacteria bacterium]|nr:DNA methyltransferase [Candidatus Kapabacteria bacterium]